MICYEKVEGGFSRSTLLIRLDVEQRGVVEDLQPIAETIFDLEFLHGDDQALTRLRRSRSDRATSVRFVSRRFGQLDEQTRPIVSIQDERRATAMIFHHDHRSTDPLQNAAENEDDEEDTQHFAFLLIIKGQYLFIFIFSSIKGQKVTH